MVAQQVAQRGSVVITNFAILCLEGFPCWSYFFRLYLEFNSVFCITSDSPDLIFSDKVLWGEEPILPVQLYLIRHGQQSSFNGSIIDVFCPSSELGKIQSMRTSELLYQWTNGFKGTNMLSVISSELQRSKETADIIWVSVLKHNLKNKKKIVNEHQFSFLLIFELVVIQIVILYITM